jgi:hypothetical protein
MTVPTEGRPIGFWLKLVDGLIDARQVLGLSERAADTNEDHRIHEHGNF